MASRVPRPLMWVIAILIALVVLPMIALSIAVAAIAWMPLMAVLGAAAIWILIRWHQASSGPRTTE